MRVSPQLLDHPKFLRLQAELAKVDPAVNALEILLRIWGHCETSRHGEVWPGADAEYVETVCRWFGEPGKLAAALTKPLGKLTPFVVLNGEGATISGWDVHNAGLHASWTARSSKKRRFTAKLEQPTDDHSSEAWPDATDDATDDDSINNSTNTPPKRRGEGSRVEWSRGDKEERDSASAGGFAEMPTDEEIDAEAAAYPGSPARGVPAEIPPPWLHMWRQTYLARSLRNPRGWRHALGRDFERDWQDRKPLALGQPSAANCVRTVRRRSWGAHPDTGQRARTEAHLGDQSDHLARIERQRIPDAAQCAAVELGLPADAIPAVDRVVDEATEPEVAGQRTRGHAVACTPTAVASTLITKSAMNVNTTVSLTAFPTPAGPPPTEMPL
mgnify:CR=1 FL=1